MLKTDYANTRKKLDFTPSHRQWLHDSIINAILGFISCFLLFKQSPLANIASFPFTCLFFFRNFSLMHEAVHHTAHPNRKLNEVTGTLTGIFCFLEYTLWKEMHIKHHYWTGNLQQDPVLALIRFYNSRTKRIQKFFDVSWKLCIPLVAFAQHVVFSKDKNVEFDFRAIKKDWVQKTTC
jgi:fatty acid desaturase